jgi:hypothetical protein
MWPRVAEIVLALWLAASPFILGPPDLGRFATIQAFVCAVLVVVASCLSYWEPTRHARALTALVGLWLVIRAYAVSPFPAPPALQNEFLVGPVLVMFAVVPNHAADPPRAWRRFIASEPARETR